jgi:hypothetical protein
MVGFGAPRPSPSREGGGAISFANPEDGHLERSQTFTNHKNGLSYPNYLMFGV